MSPRQPGRRSVVILSVIVSCAACGAPGAGGTASPTMLGASTTAAAVEGASVGPASSTIPPPTVTIAPSPRSTAGTNTARPSAASSEPPPATLAAEGGDPSIGQLGSYTWAGGGSDSPWLPGAPLRVGAGERLTVSIGGGVPVAGWTARAVAARSGSGPMDGSGAVALGEGSPPVAFIAQPHGSWSVQVAVQFADGLGSATYYWHLDVD